MAKSTSFWDHPIETIEKALALRKQIEALKQSVTDIMGGVKTTATGKVDGRKKKRSAATRAKMAAAAKARWAARKKGTVAKVAIAEPEKKTRKKRKPMSAEARAKIAAAQRARWSKAKAA